MTRAREIATQGGLVLLSTTTIGSAVSSVVVSNAFSSTYDSYKIIIGGTGIGSTPLAISLKLGASTTQYYSSGIFTPYTGGTSALQVNNGSVWTYAGWANSSTQACNIDLIGPANATYTKFFAKYTAVDGSTPMDGIHQVATAYTDFTLATNTGTLTGGTISVYGYKK